MIKLGKFLQLFGSVIAAKCMISACMSWFLSGMMNIFFFQVKIFIRKKKPSRLFAVALNHSWVVGVSISVRIWELFGRKVSQYQNGPGDVLCPRAIAYIWPFISKGPFETKYEEHLRNSCMINKTGETKKQNKQQQQTCVVILGRWIDQFHNSGVHMHSCKL